MPKVIYSTNKDLPDIEPKLLRCDDDVNHLYWLPITEHQDGVSGLDWDMLQTLFEDCWNPNESEPNLWWMNRGEYCKEEDCYTKNGKFDDKNSWGPDRTKHIGEWQEFCEFIEKATFYKLIGTEEQGIVYNLQTGNTKQFVKLDFTGESDEMNEIDCGEGTEAQMVAESIVEDWMTY